MEEFIVPPAPNWFSSGSLRSSPEGYIAYASHNQIVVLQVPDVKEEPGDDNWRKDVPSLQPPKTFIIKDAHEEKSKVCSVCWCPVVTDATQDRNLVSSSDSGSVRIWKWSPTEYSLMGQHTLHSENRAKVFGLDWSRADPNLVVSADESGCLVRWELTTNRVKKYFFGRNCVFGLALHPEDPDLVAFGCKLGLVFIATLAAGNGRVIHKMRGHDEDCYSVSWCPVEASDWRLVSASRDKTLRVWSHTEGKSLLKLKLSQGGRSKGNYSQSPNFITCSWISQDSILSSGETGELVQWDLSLRDTKDGCKYEVLHRAHFKSLFSVCVHGDVVYSIGQDRILPVYHLKSRRMLYELPTLNGFAYCLASNPVDPSVVAVGVGDGLLRIWKTGSKQLFDMKYIKLNQSKIMSLAWHPSKEGLLGFGTDEGRVGWLDAFSGKPNVSFSAFQHRGGVYCTFWGPGIADESECAMYTVGDGKLIQHSVKTNKSHVISEMLPTSTKLNVSQAIWRSGKDKSFLVLGLEDGAVEVYTVPSLKNVLSLKHHKKLIQSLVFHPDYLSTGEESRYRDWMASASNESQILVWDLKQALCAADEHQILVCPTGVLAGHFQRVIELAWSPHHEGKLVSVSYDSSAQVWDIGTMSPIHNFQGHSKRLMCCMWHPTDPDLVMSGGEDCTLAVWNPRKQTQSSPVERKKKKPKLQNIATAKAEEKQDEELSFDELLSKHRREQLKQKEEDSTRQIGEAANVVVEDKKKTKRLAKKLYFPLYTKTESQSSARVGADCLTILKKRCSRAEDADLDVDAVAGKIKNVTLQEETVTSNADLEEIPYMGLFLGKEGVEHLLKAEVSNMEDFSSRATISLWSGDFAKTLKIAEAEGNLTDSLVAQSAGLSQRVWRQTAAAYALQLSKEGNFMKASEFFLSVHMIHQAIEVLQKNNAYEAAISIAVMRLPKDDPLISELMSGYAYHATQSGNLALAAKCWAVTGNSNQVATTLSKISSKANLRAAAFISEDPKQSEVYARQCFTDCVLTLDDDLGLALANEVPSLAWGAVFLLFLTHTNRILTSTDRLPKQLFRLIEDLCKERNVICDKSFVSSIEQFMKTTLSTDSYKSRLVRVAGCLAQAFACRDAAQECLHAVSKSLAELHPHPLELEQLVRNVFPEGTQPPQVGEALIFTPLDWQCNWPELRSIQCSEAVSILYSKKTQWSEDLLLDVSDALMLENEILCQKIKVEIEEGEAAVAAFDPLKETNFPLVVREEEVNGDAEDDGVDFTPSLTGTQTVSLSGDGHWKSDGLDADFPLPPNGLENLPPPPKQTASFYMRFLRGRQNTDEATKELQKLRWRLSKHNYLVVPFPDLTVCCKGLLEVVLKNKLGEVSEEEEADNKVSFSRKLARFGYYRGSRTHQEYFLQHF